MANNSPAKSFQLFNLDTMSGITSGIRTQIFQRLRLQNRSGDSLWARLLWENDPVSCDLFLQTGENEQWSETPLIHFLGPDGHEETDPHLWLHEIRNMLLEKGWQLQSCSSCVFWQPLATRVTVDRLPVGKCGYQTSLETVPEILSQQSGLALACDNWKTKPEIAPDEELVITIGDTSTESPIEKFMEKFAEQAAFRPTIGQRIKTLFQRNKQSSQPKSWQETLVERSGVGAGTEPCLACQGRIANLGALTVESAEGDKQTFSVWRCRVCYTLYLNDWTDRWERVDTLETEERYYRLAPADAAYILSDLHHRPGAEHPAGRHLRDEQRGWFENFLADHVAVSHQIRRGR